MPERPFPMPSLDSLIQGDRPICYGVLKPGIEEDHGVPLIRIVDMESGGLRSEGLFRITPALDKEFARSRIDAGDLLLSIQGTVGRVAIAPPELAGANISRTIARLSFAAAGDGRFYKHWFLSSDGLRAMDGAIVGTTRSSLNIGVLRKVAVPSPTGPEKSTIADILDTLDTAIRQTEAIIEKLKQVQRGLLHDLLTCGIDTNGELRPPQSQAPHLFKDSPLGWIPREWDVLPIASLVRQVTYGFTNPMPTTTEGPWMLTAADIADGRIDYSTARRTSHREFARLSRKSRPSKGDILVTKDGTLGRVAVLDRDDVCVNQSVAVLSPLEAGACAFLALYLRSPLGQDRMIADAGGSTIKHIYITTLADMLVPGPPQAEALEIERRASALEQRVQLEASELVKLHALKSGLMDDLLTGRVRVTPLLHNLS